jgi:hypothetical protein
MLSAFENAALEINDFSDLLYYLVHKLTTTLAVEIRYAF